MAKHSAGILMYRLSSGSVEVFLVHPGGPFWAKKNLAAWSIPKGEFSTNEDPLEAAKREFEEETGFSGSGNFLPLETLKQPSGKVIHAWAVEGDCDASTTKSNTFSMEWPPKSGKQQEFPEIDKAGWFSTKIAKEKLHKGQVELIDRLLKKLDIVPEEDVQEQGKITKAIKKPTQQSFFD
ncbi:MAG: NUDIX domain-containing protein [Desulfobacteraceae bacterium]|nr:NUDIX domain-containing protein [Desulfobacteraceae bacterium]